MKKLFYAVLLFGAVVFTSCNDEIIVPDFTIEAENFASEDVITVSQEETIQLNVVVSNTTDYQVKWTVNNEVASTEPTFDFVAQNLGTNVIMATVTTSDGGTSNATLEIMVEGKYKHGAFVLNEGNMSDGTGTLIHISQKGEITDSAYYKVNHSLLGNVAQDIFIADNKMYIIAQNGAFNGGEGKLVIANAETLKKEAAFDQELDKLDWPSHVAVEGEDIYLRDGAGVYTFNRSSKSLTFIEGTEGVIKNRMAVVDGKVFAAKGKSVVVLEKGKLIGTIAMPGNVSGVIKADKDNLWVSCTCSPAVICKVDAKELKIIQSNELGDAKVGQGGWGELAAPAISAKGDTIYFSNHSTLIKRHIFNEKKTEDVVQVKDYVENASMVYSNLAVDPITGEVYIATIKGYGMNYLINSIAVFNFSNTANPLKANYKNYTKFPAGIFFTENFN